MHYAKAPSGICTKGYWNQANSGICKLGTALALFLQVVVECLHLGTWRACCQRMLSVSRCHGARRCANKRLADTLSIPTASCLGMDWFRWRGSTRTQKTVGSQERNSTSIRIHGEDSKKNYLSQSDSYLTPKAQRRTSNQTVSDSRKQKSPMVSDRTLMTSGELCGQLDRCLPQYPVYTKTMKIQRAKCCLHWWATERKMDIRSKVVCCASCLVPLCFDCFDLFHEEPALVEKKEIIKDKM